MTNGKSVVDIYTNGTEEDINRCVAIKCHEQIKEGEINELIKFKTDKILSSILWPSKELDNDLKRIYNIDKKLNLEARTKYNFFKHFFVNGFIFFHLLYIIFLFANVILLSMKFKINWKIITLFMVFSYPAFVGYFSVVFASVILLLLAVYLFIRKSDHKPEFSLNEVSDNPLVMKLRIYLPVTVALTTIYRVVIITRFETGKTPILSYDFIPAGIVEIFSLGLILVASIAIISNLEKRKPS